MPAGGDNRRNAWAHGRDGRAGAALPCTPPPGQKSSGGVAQDRTPPSVIDFFPMGDFGGSGGLKKRRTENTQTINKDIRLYNSDCLVGMSRVETGTVDLVLCDLPYGSTDCSWDTVIPFEPLWEQYRRILKPRGALVLFAAQPFATDLINSARKLFRYDLIWEKTCRSALQTVIDSPFGPTN